MRRCMGLWVFLAGCSDPDSGRVPFEPIDPSDPLLGTWASANVTGQTRFGEGRFRWTFGEDGTYQRIQPRVAPTEVVDEVEAGVWDRIDDATIRRCVSPCDLRDGRVPAESAIRLEGDRMLIDGPLAMSGAWACDGAGACMAHGAYHATSWQVMLHADGTAEGTVYTCSNVTGMLETLPCHGAWTEAPALLEVTFSEPWCSPLRCPRIGDMAAGFEYRRVTSAAGSPRG